VIDKGAWQALIPRRLSMSIDYAVPPVLDSQASQIQPTSGGRAVIRAAWRRATPALRRSVREHALFIALIAVYVLAELYLPAMLGVATPFAPGFSYNFFASMSGLILAVPTCLYIFYVMIFVRPARLTTALAGDLRRFASIERVSHALPVFLLFPFFGSASSYFRVYIPSFEPFNWDPTLAEWDRWLHGGVEPWEWLQPILGYPYVTALINGFYHLWFAVMFGVMLWQMGSLGRPRRRMQFFLTFVLVWAVLGNIGATLMSSAGPVYYRVTGLPDPYAPLMAYLHAANETVPVLALNVQDMLWNSYAEHGLAIVGGITAMPSMHIGTCMTFVLIGFATSRRLGYFFTAFALIIQVGAVHLGWHYAIDGYVSAIGTWLIWLAVGWLLRRAAITRLLWGRDLDAPPIPQAASAAAAE
jgi:hypothetical protein